MNARSSLWKSRAWLLLCVLVPTGIAGCGDPVEHGQGAGTMGTNAEIGPVKLRNVYIERPADGTYQRGEDARLAVSLFTDESIQDSLIEVSTSFAEQVRLQWDRTCDGAAETVPAIPLRGGTVPATGGQEVTGHPPYYLTLDGFTREIPAGTTVPVTFTFADAGTGTVQATVQGRGERDEPAHYSCLDVPPIEG